MKPHPPMLAPENFDAPHVPESLILPTQWRDLSRVVTHSPELRLMRAVLDDAFYCVMSYCGSPHVRAQRLFAEAYTWLMNDDDHWLYAFVSICRYLDLDESWIRRGMRAWLKQHPHGFARSYDQAYQKKTRVTPGTRHARYRGVAWQRKIRGCEQWRVYVRTPDGRTCEIGSYGTKSQACAAVLRAKKNAQLSVAKALAKKEAEIAA